MAQRLFDEIKRLIDDTLSSVHTAMPGTITSANGMTASVKPSVTYRTADGKSMAYPSISGCRKYRRVIPGVCRGCLSYCLL